MNCLPGDRGEISMTRDMMVHWLMLLCSPLLLPSSNVAAAFSTRHCITSSPSTTHHATIPSDIDIPIIFENDKLLAINKPPHISHHDDPTTGELGIMSIIRSQQQTQTFSYRNRLWSVHRLDKVTSGILLLAKDPTTASTLMRKFQQKEITKYYTAISAKKAKKKQGRVRGNMVMGRRGSYKLVNSKNKVQQSNVDKEEVDDDIDTEKKKQTRGGYAVTRYFTAGLGNLSMTSSLLERVGNKEAQSVPRTAILFQPHTGKTKVRVCEVSMI